MEVKVPKGKYILAVSGGVDSMTLLNLLASQPGVELIVAHFNHGIRPDSDKDEVLVNEVAQAQGLVLEVGRKKLGPNASEEVARAMRYKFLHEVLIRHKAKKIITAHHQDDLIETALINIIRGTGRQGLSAIATNQKILRPLLEVPKEDIIASAKSRRLEWIEDITNLKEDYLRNYLRVKVLTNLTTGDRQKLVKILEKVAKINVNLDNELATLSHNTDTNLNRLFFSLLPNEVSQELLAFKLRSLKIKNFDRQTIDRINLAIKAGRPDSRHPIKQNVYLKLDQETATFVTP
jgi:tRNA(Ile)-lysidine synthetase-like protein